MHDFCNASYRDFIKIFLKSVSHLNPFNEKSLEKRHDKSAHVRGMETLFGLERNAVALRFN